MSCNECDNFQDSNDTKFFRWKNADIEVRACKKHLVEVFDALRDYDKLRRELDEAKNWNDEKGRENIQLRTRIAKLEAELAKSCTCKCSHCALAGGR